MAKSKKVFAAAMFLMIAIVPPILAYKQKGWTWRYSPIYSELLSNTKASHADRNVRGISCSFDEFQKFDPAECLSLSETKINILVWGDSVVDYAWHGIHNGLPKERFNLLQFTPSGCTPGLFFGTGNCRKANDYIVQFLKEHKVDLVILGTHRPYFDNLRTTLDWLRSEKQRVIVVGLPFHIEPSLPQVVRPYHGRSVTRAEINKKAIATLQPKYIEGMNNFARFITAQNVPYFDMRPQICQNPRDTNTCNFIIKDSLLTMDSHHLSPEASVQVFFPLAEVIRSIDFKKLAPGKDVLVKQIQFM